MVVLTETKISREKQARLSYLDNPAAVGLLDVIAASIAEEFVERVKKSPEVFEEKRDCFVTNNVSRNDK